MKRTPLIRRTPLKSSGNLKRTPLARISKRKRKLNATQKPLLDWYRETFPVCQFDGCGEFGSAIHEMAAGSHREKARESRACILHLCRKHHRELQGAPYPEQLAHKLLSDYEGTNLQVFCDVIGRASSAITLKDVLFYMRVDA